MKFVVVRLHHFLAISYKLKLFSNYQSFDSSLREVTCHMGSPNSGDFSGLNSQPIQRPRKAERLRWPVHLCPRNERSYQKVSDGIRTRSTDNWVVCSSNYPNTVMDCILISGPIVVCVMSCEPPERESTCVCKLWCMSDRGAPDVIRARPILNATRTSWSMPSCQVCRSGTCAVATENPLQTHITCVENK